MSDEAKVLTAGEEAAVRRGIAWTGESGSIPGRLLATLDAARTALALVPR